MKSYTKRDEITLLDIWNRRISRRAREKMRRYVKTHFTPDTNRQVWIRNK